MKSKIARLVRSGYKQAAFGEKKNAAHFAKLWKERGYKVSMMRSSGPTVEGSHSRKSYYMIARKPIKTTKRIKPRRKHHIRRSTSPFGTMSFKIPRFRF
jgi:hypothetical protein